MDNTRQTRLKQFFSMQFLVIFILHIQRPKCSVVASSRKVIIATFRRGTETRMEEEREKKKKKGEEGSKGRLARRINFLSLFHWSHEILRNWINYS